jgi:hypothetical protein
VGPAGCGTVPTGRTGRTGLTVTGARTGGTEPSTTTTFEIEPTTMRREIIFQTLYLSPSPLF